MVVRLLLQVAWIRDVFPGSGQAAPSRLAIVRVTSRQVLAAGLMLLGFLMAVVLAVLAGRKTEPTVATSVLLVVLSGVFQLAGARVLQGEGQADPALARASLRRLLRLQARASAAEISVQSAYETQDARQLKATMGQLSVEFSWLNEGLIEAAEDWASFHPTVLSELREELNDGGAADGQGGGDTDRSGTGA